MDSIVWGETLLGRTSILRSFRRARRVVPLVRCSVAVLIFQAPRAAGGARAYANRAVEAHVPHEHHGTCCMARQPTVTAGPLLAATGLRALFVQRMFCHGRTAWVSTVGEEGMSPPP